MRLTFFYVVTLVGHRTIRIFYVSEIRTSNVLWLKSFFKGTNNWSYFLYCCRKLQGSANDGRWHHICVTWRSSDGRWQFYKDGELHTHNKGLCEGCIIKGGGSLVLGQDQDAVGGGFESQASFQGSLTNVNVWSYVLSEGAMKSLSKSCLSGVGNVYKWSDFIYGVKGKTAVVIPSPCYPLSSQPQLLFHLLVILSALGDDITRAISDTLCSIFLFKMASLRKSTVLVIVKRASQQ